MNTFLARNLLRLIRSWQKAYNRFMTRLYAIELKASAAHCGDNVHIYYPFTISGYSNLEIGNNVHINRGAFIKADGVLKISDNVHIGPNLLIYTVNHNYKGDSLPYDSIMVRKPVVIGRNVWIGANVTIVPGTTIGDGAIIGAGSVVSGTIPPLAIVGSSPSRIIRYRDEAHYAQLDAAGRYGGVNGKLYTEENHR